MPRLTEWVIAPTKRIVDKVRASQAGREDHRVSTRGELGGL